MTPAADVAIFTRWIWGGGAERVMANLAIGLASQGLKVDLIIMQSREGDAETFGPNVRVIDLNIQAHQTKGLWMPTGLQSVHGFPKLVSYLQENRPPVLLSATHFINEIALLAKRVARVPTRIIVTEHTFLSKEVQLTEQLSSRLVPWTVRSLYTLADQIVAVSHGVAKDLNSYLIRPGKSIQVIYNPVVTPGIYSLAQVPIEHPWFQQKDRPIVIGAGRFVRQKDFSTLLRAFAQMRQSLPARLVLLGDGREKALLEGLARDLGIAPDFWMPGFVNNPYAYIKQADVFALSSAWEGLPTVLIEALALGTPVVSTNCPSGPAEILQDGQYGHLVPVHAPEALAGALLATLRGDRRMAPDSWIQEFTLEQVIQKYMAVMGVQSPGSFPAQSLTGTTSEITAIAPSSSDFPDTRKSPLVSIVIPAYNAAELIEEALATIQQQTYPHWEVIVVEDGTRDGTEDIVRNFAQQVGESRVHYIRQVVNQGISYTRNTGIKAAQGEYIALLDHDDLWHPDHLESLVNHLQDTEADVAFAAANFVDYAGQTPLGWHGPKAEEWSNFPDSLLNRVFIPVSGVLMKKTVFAIVGGFDGNLKKVEDLDYWLRCIAVQLKFSHLPKVTNSYRLQNPKSLSANKAVLLEWHARVLRKHRHLKSVSRLVKQRVIARYHLGVVRRNIKNNPLKSSEFILWTILIAPLGLLMAVGWFILEKFGRAGRYA